MTLFTVVSVVGKQVVAVAEDDGEPPATLVVNYEDVSSVMDKVGDVWKVDIS